ncbi:carbohydrate ABC transporter permease [Rugosimonospora acidiphila]|uniref:Carbohydrate ABC transporter permease n=1 Tax=Rugosimonospora acidiphila TaxID=556531 RepID=A0ABP9S4A5_9ACTN
MVVQTATPGARPPVRGTRRNATGVPRRQAVRPHWSRMLIHLLLALCAVAFVAPLLMVLSASFSSENAINRHGYSFLPRQFTTFAYRYVIGDSSQLVQAYGVSIVVTVVGTLVSLLVMSMLAYTLSRREFALRRSIGFYLLFAMLFSGGLVPSYILITQYLHLQDTLFALILPYLVSPWFVVILRTYFMSLPNDIMDAARIDGAGEFRTFFRIVLPLSGPAMATVGLFTALTYWNDWWLGLLYIDNDKLAPVQLLLYRIISNIDFAASNQTANHLVGVPVQTVRMAIAVLAIGPIIIAFGFVQRFFVRGITIGGLKD